MLDILKDFVALQASPVHSPMSQRLYPFLAVYNLSIGLALSAAFFM